MKNKVVVITGGTSGIGQVAAEHLASLGARIVLVARDRSRAESTLQRLREKAPGLAHRSHYADLSVLSEMKRVAAEIAAAEPRIDVLLNNAGAMFDRRRTTVDSFELTFATNHLPYFVLTHILRDRLLAADQGRVVNTSSEAHRGTTLDFADLQSANGYGGLKAYQRSKLCNILFTRELARRFAGTKVTANALHPGFVNTRFGDNNTGLLTKGFLLAKRFAISPEQGAQTLIHLASSDQVENSTGEYFYKCRPKAPTKEAQDDNSAQRLWQETMRLTFL